MVSEIPLFTNSRNTKAELESVSARASLPAETEQGPPTNQVFPKIQEEEPLQ
jgi:hypothetical protein